jgi:hypothetical protein
MKRLVAAAVAAALLAAWAAPAEARWHRYHHHDGFGSFLTGAILVGGIASVASTSNRHSEGKQDFAVRTCSAEAEGRTGGRILDIGHVGKSHGYYTVDGLIENGRDAPRETFTCTVRGGAIYSFRASPAAA